MVVIDRYIDNRREYEFELALQELEKKQREEKEALDGLMEYYEELAKSGIWKRISPHSMKSICSK